MAYSGAILMTLQPNHTNIGVKMFEFHVPVPWNGGILLNILAAKNSLRNRKQWTWGNRKGNKLPTHIFLWNICICRKLSWLSSAIHSRMLSWCNSFQPTYLNDFWSTSDSSIQCPLIKFNRNETAPNGNWLWSRACEQGLISHEGNLTRPVWSWLIYNGHKLGLIGLDRTGMNFNRTWSQLIGTLFQPILDLSLRCGGIVWCFDC